MSIIRKTVKKLGEETTYPGSKISGKVYTTRLNDNDSSSFQLALQPGDFLNYPPIVYLFITIDGKDSEFIKNVVNNNYMSFGIVSVDGKFYEHRNVLYFSSGGIEGKIWHGSYPSLLPSQGKVIDKNYFDIYKDRKIDLIFNGSLPDKPPQPNLWIWIIVGIALLVIIFIIICISIIIYVYKTKNNSSNLPPLPPLPPLPKN